MNYLGETLQVSDAIQLINSTLEQTLPAIMVEGEVSSFKINKGKWVFFDIKDEESTLGCFMPVFQLGIPLEDGMKVKLVAIPKLTKWGKFSLTVKSVAPSGQGSIKKAYIILKSKLESEGLFELERKRQVPEIPEQIGVISSDSAAGWEDFKRIANERWRGVLIKFANVQVQGLDSPSQIVKAIKYFNEHNPKLDAIAIVRGGGSLDDLSSFNDELLVRAIVASKIPIVVGVGHENDESLAALAADVNAATPTHAASIIFPDRTEFISEIMSMRQTMAQSLRYLSMQIAEEISLFKLAFNNYFDQQKSDIKNLVKLFRVFDPNVAMRRGYAVIRQQNSSIITQPGLLKKGQSVIIETIKHNIDTKVDNVRKK